MKTMKKILMGLAAAVGITTAATAATPIAVWDGDFSNLTSGGVTLDVNGNTVLPDGSGIQITKTQTDASNGVLFKGYVSRAVTVLVGYTNLTTTADSYTAIATLGSVLNNDSNQDLVGLCVKPTESAGVFQSGYWTNTKGGGIASSGEGVKYFAYVQDHSANTGAKAYSNASGDWAKIYEAAGLRSSNIALLCGSIGGISRQGTRYASQQVAPATGMVISRIAIFDAALTQEEIAGFDWSTPTKYVSGLSLNFGASGYNLAEGAFPEAGLNVGSWYNVNGNTVNNAQVGDAFVTIAASGTYQNTKKTAQYLKGYLDDGTVSITVTNLTGVAYDLYIICSSDNATGWSYKTVNGKNYYGKADGEATLGATTWGSNSALVGTLGSNIMVIRGIMPDADGKIAITSVRNSGYRGCIAAIQLGEVTDVIIKDFALTLGEDASWSSAAWNPSLPETGMTADATATVTVENNPTLTLDGTITVGELVVNSPADTMLTIKKETDAVTSFGTINVDNAVKGLTLDSREGFTACAAMLNAARTVNNKFYFLGEGENGATLDYGTAQNNYSFSGHYIFQGGTHTFQNCSESAALLFGANASVDNPTLWVKDGATLNFKSRNPCGWNAAASDAGVVRIDSGSKVVLQNSAAGTWYWSQQFYLNDGATLEIATAAEAFRTVGNSSSKPHFVVPDDSAATITAVEGVSYVLPDNNGGAGVFSVGANSTLTLAANLKTLKNGRQLIKYGDGTLKLTGGVSAFNGALEVKAGTLEDVVTTDFGGSATVTVDAGATYQIDAAADRTFAKAIGGAGKVVKAGEGKLTVAAGQFGDNIASIAGGVLQFTITHEQAREDVTLCKCETDISEFVTIVNEAGQEVSGEFKWEDNTLTFKANCVDVSFTLDTDTDWSEVAESLGWINSPESTLTVTCTRPEAVLRFDQEIIAKSIKFVSEDGTDAIITDGSFPNMQIASYDFTEAEGGVTISFEELETAELRLVTGVPIAGFANVRTIEETVPEGYGFYADASNIWLCKQYTDVTRTSPTTEDVQAFTNFFVGVKSGDWADKANWRTAKDGLLVPYQYEKYPQSSEAQNPNWYPACFDGALIDEYEGTKEITCATVEGWETKLDFRNGVSVKIERLKKFANNFMWIDESSSVSIDKLGGSTFQYGYIFNVAGSLTIGEFDANVASIPYTYNLGENAIVTYTDGIKNGTQHALNGGKLVAEGDGIAVPVTITNDVAIMTPALAAVTINQDSTLTLSSTAEGDLVIGGNWTNDSTLNVAGGIVVFKPGVTPGSYTEDGGKVIIGQTVTVNDCGKIAVTGAMDDVRLFDIGGNPVPVTKVEGGYAYYEWDVTGKNCWWDYEFNGNLESVGTDTVAMTAEGTTPYYNAAETALNVGYGTPWRDVKGGYPADFTAVIYGKMVENAGHLEIGFGSTTGGTKYGIVFACGDPEQNEVRLLVTSGTKVLETVSMKVTDAYKSNHLYAFACQTIAEGEEEPLVEKTQVSVYLDGKLLQVYKFDGKVTLGTGFQVGSIHGGGLSGYTKATTANTEAELDFLRVYQGALNEEAMARYAELCPYVSRNGTSTRTIAAAEELWACNEGDNSWTVTPYGEESYAANAALAGSVIEIGSSYEEAIVSMNLTESIQYESLHITDNGGYFTLISADGSVAPTITGLSEIGAYTTVAYDAINFGNIEVKDTGSLIFDFSSFPFEDYYSDTTIAFTGFVTGEEDSVYAQGLPEEGGIRSATFGKNQATGQYELKIKIDENTPFIFTIAEGAETGTWTFDGDEVTEELVDANPKTAIVKAGAGTLVKELADRTYILNEGVFKTTNATDKAANITVNSGATFDFNGRIDSLVTITLNGGSVVNNGVEMGSGKRQIKSDFYVEQDSSVGGLAAWGLISSGYNANRLHLGGATLAKTGTNTFFLANTTVSNGVFAVNEGTLQIYRATTFADNAELTLAEDATLQLSQALYLDKLTGDGGTIDNGYKGYKANFTLAGSVKLAGAGAWGTNRLDDAIVDVGNLRGLAFAGTGAIDLKLTAEEIAQTDPIVIFESEDDTVTMGKVFDPEGTELTEDVDYTVDGGSITLVPAAPGPSWIDPSDTENLLRYQAWALYYGVADPSEAIKEAFLFNVANNDYAVEAAQSCFNIKGISIDEEGEVVIEPPQPADVGVEYFNGDVNVRGAANPGDDFTLDVDDENAKFFRAFLELIPAN